MLIGDADPSFLSHSQMQNLAEFVTEKGGGVLFIAGEQFDPLSLPGDAAGDCSCRSSWPRPATRRRVGNAIAAFRPELTAEGRSSPIFRFGDDEAPSAQIWQNLPELYWYLEAPRKKPGRARPGRAPDRWRAPTASCRSSSTSSSARASRCSTPSTTPGGGGSASATATSAGSGSRRSGSWPGRSWSASGRPRSRPTAAATSGTSRSRSASGSPTPAWRPPGGEVVVQVERKGQGPAQARRSSRRPAARNVFEGALPQAAEGEYEVRLLPPPVLEGPIPTATFRVEPPAGEIERVQMNEPELIRAADG